MTSSSNTRASRLGAAGLALALVLTSYGLTSCSATDTELAAASTPAESLWDSTQLHTIDVDLDPDTYAAIIASYIDDGEKDWAMATVTIDGVVYNDAGIRLKGNSSLRELSAVTAEQPEDLPWLISLDTFVDDQNHQGTVDIVIRSNSTETSMNEAVALELLEAAGLATEEAISVSLSFNGGETSLRLAIEHPDAAWEAKNFTSDGGLLYKADSTGDYSYRGDDEEAYDEVFNQKVGDDDLGPLTEFLNFINNADDETFADDLSEHLDVEAFATYLAFQDLIGNFDDIDGPGNNSYLHYDEETMLITVVNWDLNLAFNTANVDGGGPGAGGGGQPRGVAPDRAAGGGQRGAAPDGAVRARIGGPSEGNILAERFQADAGFRAVIEQANANLTATLFTSGLADQIVSDWTSMYQTEATALVDTAVVEADADAITSEFPT